MVEDILTKNKSDWDVFAQEDPFNKGNFVEGCICKHSGDSYGSLIIEKVNGRDCSQVILCTPKIIYPFDASGNWHWSTKAVTILRYEKLDGTNIFAYKYHNSEGQEFLTYKLRLRPFVENSRFGPFKDLWNEVLEKKPVLKKLIASSVNLSFELYGSRNAHLISYDVPLSAALLFARKGDKIIPPRAFISSNEEELWDIANFKGEINQDYTSNYQQSQQESEKNLQEKEDGLYSGSEGEVWYLLDESGKWHLYKCKPETIEQIHWSQGGLGKNVIKATIENAFENWDIPTVEQVKQLLLEEFKEAQIEAVSGCIVEQLDLAIQQKEFKEKVFMEYSWLGLDIVKNKVAVMRALSTKFSRGEMGKVYAAIVSKAGLKSD